MDNGKILVTGGLGYVGAVTMYKLIKAGHSVVVIDTKYSNTNNYYCGDIGDEILLDRIFTEHKITHIIHCASYIDVGESMTNPTKYFDNNIGKFTKLLNAMVKYQCTNIIFSSTCATYGIPLSVPLTELHSQNPINIYGWTKLVCEQMLGHMEKIHNFNVVILRYFNVAGAYINDDTMLGENHEPETHLIPLAISALLNDKTFNIYGTDYKTYDGTCIRDYIHVEDLADAHILALGGSGYYNLGSEYGYSVNEIISKIEEISNKKLNINYCARREGDPSTLYADSTKFRGKFDWVPKHDINSIIDSAIKYHSK